MLPHWQKQLENVELKKNDMFWQEYQFSNSVTKRINAFTVLALRELVGLVAYKFTGRL
jgi:hypothetical protein